MLFIFVRCLKRLRENTTLRGLKKMNYKSFIAIAAALCFAVVSFGCGGAANTTNTTNTTVSKNGNSTSTTVSNTTSTTNTTAPANTETTKMDASSPNTGVAECDEYIQKYEACLTKIAKTAPQIEQQMKQAFEAQRTSFKTAAANPQSKATLSTTCKSAIETAKASTKAYACDW
jgi:hypothetical protein